MRSIIVFVILVIVSSCTTIKSSQLKNGDLLFVSANNEGLSKAIDAVTQTKQSNHFSHIALLEKENNQLFVMHAGTKNGSERISLQDFVLDEKNDKNTITVYRLKRKYQHTIKNAIEVAKTWLGKPYNYSYVLSDEKLYCSDFVQRSFAKDTVFKLNPMTFINPQTGKTDVMWVEFYKKQNIEVPEGKPGCNPNGMASSDKIKRMGILK